jgi:hypothetical protein
VFPENRLIDVCAEASEVTARACQGCHELVLNRIARHSDNRDRRSGRFECSGHAARNQENQVGLKLDHLAGDLGEARGAPLRRSPLYDEVLPFDVPEPP